MLKSFDDVRIAKVLTNPIVQKSIKLHAGNWSQDWENPNLDYIDVLEDFAAIAAKKILESDLPFPEIKPEWKKALSNATFPVINPKTLLEEQTPLLIEALRGRVGDKTKEFEENMWGYSLVSIAHGVACVAYMIKHNLDPSLLKATEEESNEAMLQLAEEMSRTKPDKVLIVDPSKDSPEEIATELKLLIDPPDVSGMLSKL